jgi:hypothetical protein
MIPEVSPCVPLLVLPRTLGMNLRCNLEEGGCTLQSVLDKFGNGVALFDKAYCIRSFGAYNYDVCTEAPGSSETLQLCTRK